ncbi:MAG: segregation/condensation protein A [Planctomycetota bacterium]
MDYSIKLENFQGPMDLLLHLIRKEEVDVYEISVARVIDQFLEYVEHLEQMDIDLASEFSVMAATLMVVKSRMLLPVEEVNLEEEIDAESDLVHQLLEYKRFRDLSRNLKELSDERSLMFPRRKASIPEAEVDKDLGEVDLWDLISAFSKVVRETMGSSRVRTIVNEERAVSEYVEDIVARIEIAGGSIDFAKLLGNAKTRDAIVGYFIGMLELIRQFRAFARQTGVFGEIEIVLRTAEETQRIISDAAGQGHESEESEEDAVDDEMGDGSAPDLDDEDVVAEEQPEETGIEVELEVFAGDEPGEDFDEPGESGDASETAPESAKEAEAGGGHEDEDRP